MKEYDVIVIGSGTGLGFVSKAVEKKLRVALVAERFLGGTCLNVGCVPSKTLIYSADRVQQIREAAKLGIQATVTKVDFRAIMERMRQIIDRGVRFNREWIEESDNLDFYEAHASFNGNHTMQIEDGEQIRGEKIFISCGASPAIPAIEGLEESGYLTNETLLSLNETPESMAILGGGYIAVEYAHFFAAMGTAVTIIEMGERLVSNEEPEVSDLLKKELEKRMSVRTNTRAVKVAGSGGDYTVYTKGPDGKEGRITAKTVLVALGRKSNAPSLNPAATGVELDDRYFVKVDDYLETTKKHIWATGDATGRQMFTHAGDKEVEIA